MEIGALNQNTATQEPGGSVGAAYGARNQETPSFKETWTKFMSEYGKKPEKAREIKKELDKDDYLRIMVEQMKHQDPTKPFEADKLASEMAQVGMIKHMQDVGQALKKLEDNNRPLERIAMTGMIGKTVTIDKTRFIHHKDSNEVLDFTLDRDAADVRLVIISQTGDVVKEESLGSLASGKNTYSWDGKKTNTLAAEDGTYFFRIEAKDANGVAVNPNFSADATVIGVSFEKGEPVFLVGDQKSQIKVGMNNIVRVVDHGSQIPGAQLSGSAAALQQQPLLTAPQQAEAQAASQFLNQAPAPVAAPAPMQKMNSNADLSHLSADERKIIEEQRSYAAQRRQSAEKSISAEAAERLKRSQASPDERRQQLLESSRDQGFPNGLSDVLASSGIPQANSAQSANVKPTTAVSTSSQKQGGSNE